MKTLSQKSLIYFIILFSIVCIYSCNFNATYLNSKQDKEDGERITTLFFENIKHKTYDDTFKYIDDRFLKVTPKEKMMGIYKMTLEKLGKLDSTRIVKWETREIKGTNARTEYQYQFLSHYAKSTATETVCLMKENNGPIKIVSYNINSDGFIK